MSLACCGGSSWHIVAGPSGYGTTAGGGLATSYARMQIRAVPADLCVRKLQDATPLVWNARGCMEDPGGYIQRCCERLRCQSRLKPLQTSSGCARSDYAMRAILHGATPKRITGFDERTLILTSALRSLHTRRAPRTSPLRAQLHVARAWRPCR